MKSFKELTIPIFQELAVIASYNNRLPTNTDKTAYIFLYPDYGNIGDLAIGYAQIQYLKQKLTNYKIISINVSETYKYIAHIKKTIKTNDLIFITGGGNFGDLYPKADYGRLFIAKSFPNNKICSLPQTIYFTNTNYGQRRLKINKKIISEHKEFTIFTRENVSFDSACSYFNNEVHLTPDIVFSLLNDCRNITRNVRDKIIFTIRADGEKFVSEYIVTSLANCLPDNKIIFRDTIINQEYYSNKYNQDYINSILNDYRSAKIVITDRLHGMIFAAITGTPCIVLPNANHKISATYNTWLKQSNYIIFLEKSNVNDFRLAIHSLLKLKNNNYKKISLPFTELDSYLGNYNRTLS